MTLPQTAFAFAVMGHANVDTTIIYVHHVPRHDDADRLSSLIAEIEGVEAAIPA